MRSALLSGSDVTVASPLTFVFKIPHVTSWLLLAVLAGFLLADAVAMLFQTITAFNRGGRWTWAAANALIGISREGIRWRIAVAALSVAVGLFILAGPSQDSVRVLLAIAAYGVIAGGLRVQAARRGFRWKETS